MYNKGVRGQDALTASEPMARRYAISPTAVLDSAVLPEGIRRDAQGLHTRFGDTLDVFPYGRSFRWVVYDRNDNDQSFTPGQFKAALAVLTSLANTPPARKPDPEPEAPLGSLEGDALFRELLNL